MFRKALFAAMTLMTGLLLALQTAEPKLHPEMLVTTGWLAEHLSDPNMVVLCVNSAPEFYSRGHIPGARQIKLGDIAVTRDGIPNELPPVEELRKVFAAAGVSNSSRVVLYGERSNLFAARAYFTLDYLGVAGRAALLDGGIEKWTAEHRPFSTETPKIKPATLKISPRPGILVDTAAMRDLAQKPEAVTVLDARPTKEFTGEQLSEDVTKAGHIPSATSLYWMDMLVSRENPILKPEAELRRMYAEAHAAPGRKLVTYCRTGMQSSFDYFVAKYLGYEPSMYDASFFEWSLKNLPVEK
ncbi:MAG TPA: sulfurtransferase [Candidatus Angelobacter sp.]|jgi:thiosulfate/3-mercaptopyruvate sulfurtransferase|nr:sulfurtransferase [Candidatus Angelobacter sp.]